MKTVYQTLLKLAYICLLLLGTVYALTAQTAIFSEDFNGYGNGATSGINWSTDVSGCNLRGGDYFEVHGNKFEGRDLDCEAIWMTSVLDISGYQDISIEVDLQEAGNMESNDYMWVRYKLDGGAEQTLANNGYNNNDFNNVTASETGINGSTLQLIIRVRNDNGSEKHRIRDVHIEGTEACLYSENFNSYSDGTDNSSKWSISGNPDGHFEVNNNKLEANDLGREITWSSSVIDISNHSNINISVDMSTGGNEMEDNDYMQVYYKLNGGSLTLLSNGSQINDFSPVTATASGINGSTLQLVIKAKNTTHHEFFYVDDIEICGTPGAPSASITLSADITDVSCNGGSDGSIDLTPSISGGSGSFSYEWSTGAVSQDLNSMSAGTYTVTVEASSASATASFTIAEPSGISLSNTATDVSCAGGNNGSINLSVSGGTSPYDYNWSNGSSDQDISSLSGGVYMVTVTDDNSCTASSVIGVADGAAISITGTASEETAAGNEDGSIDITVTGGAGSFSYEWSNGANSADITGLAGGTYTVTVTDGNSCTASESFTVTTISSGGGVTGLSGYCFRKEIEIQSSKVAGSSSHTDFPVLISFTDSDIRSTGNGGNVESTDGYDIRFTADDGTTELSYQLNSYDASTGELIAWVKVPSLSGSSNTSIYMYYGNDAVSTDGSSTDVWHSAFKGVWHLDEDLPSSNNIYDATANGIDGEKRGSTHASDHKAGKIGMAYDLDGSNDYYEMDTDLNTWLGGTGTVSAWIKTSQWGHSNAWQSPGITGIEEAGGGNDIFWGVIDGSGKLYAQAGNGSNAKTSPRVNDNQWHHVVITRNHSNGEIKVYMDGDLEDTDNSETGTKTNSFYSLGRIEDTGGSAEYLEGQLDEVRMLNTILDADWIKTEFNNQDDPSSFYTVGSEESVNCGGSTPPSGGPSGYSYCKNIATNPAYVHGSGSHTDFPFLVELTHNDLRSTGNGGQVTSSNGFDIIFTNEAGTTQWSHELESYNASTGKVVAWVKIPSLSTSTATNFKIYFGNSSVTTNQSSTDTWTENYKAIYHLNNSFDDATDNGNDGTNYNSNNLSSSKIGSGRTFDGNSDYIRVSNSSSLNITGNQVTISAWAKVDNVGQDAPFAVKGTTVNQEQYMLGVDTESQPQDTYNMRVTTNNGHSRYNVGEPNFGSWDYVTYVYDGSLGSNPRMKMYVNGVLVSSQNASGSIESNSSGDLWIGKRPLGDNRYYDGALDEIRISDAAHDAHWIRTEYDNQNNPTATITVTSCTVEEVPCFTWLGTTSADWTTGTNWSCGEVPTCNDTVIIPAGTPNTATITSGNTGYAKNLNIETGATIQMGTTGELHICGNLVNNGSIDLSGGTTRFIGSNEQTISGNSPEFHNVVINNTSSTGVVFNISVRVSNTISFDDGHVYTGTDTLILLNTDGDDETILDYSEESFVVGKLNRALTRNTDDYVFPVGKDDEKLFWVNIENNNMQGIGNLTVWFTDLERHDDSELNVTAQDITYQRICPEGMWVIEPNSQPSSGKYTVDVGITNFAGLNDNNYGVLKRPKGGRGDQWNKGQGTLDLLGGLGRLVTSGIGRLKNLTSFSEFGVGTGGGSELPIKLASFEAEYIAEDNWVKVDWETQVEINNDYFLVQRSIDGLEFEDVAEVDGAGNSTITLAYTAYDQNPPRGMVYYRLKQIDFDGKYSYSEMVPVMITGEYAKTDVKVYPNPASSFVNIDMQTEARDIKVMVLTLGGAMVQYQEATHPGGAFKARVDLSDALSNGQYIVRISYGETETVKKLMIVR